MFSNLTAKLAMRKMGISSNALNVSLADVGLAPDTPNGGGTKSTTTADSATRTEEAGRDTPTKAWPPAWMSVKALPLTVQPWLAPPPAPTPVATACPKLGDVAPLDRGRKLAVGGGRPVVVVFLRCVGCAFAQKSFLALRTLANRYPGQLTCVAVSHSSAVATHKWIDLLGGAWDVQVLIDEDRSVYAAWGLGLGSVWYVLNPSTQIQSWRETGWLGQSVATYMDQRRSLNGGGAAATAARATTARSAVTAGQPGSGEAPSDGPATIMGSKWQQSGAFATDGSGIVVWGRKAARADDVLNLDEAVPALRL